MAKVFFSYAHQDESLRDELEVHLAVLKRDGVIEAWHDQRLIAGDELHTGISKHLEDADVVLLLVSPYFLASTYCFEKELQLAMQRHARGEARVIPIILRPCDWLSTVLGSLAAIPKDGRAVTKFPDHHDAFLEITKAIREAVKKFPAHSNRIRPAAPPEPDRSTPSPVNRSSNLRIKKSFSDHNKDAFIDESFDSIANFFEESLKELQSRNRGITTRFKRIDATRFAAYIYRGGESISECGIRLDDTFGRNCINYSTEATSTNSHNESLSVDDNGHSLYLKAMGTLRASDEKTKQLTVEGASEYLWSVLLEPLQR